MQTIEFEELYKLLKGYFEDEVVEFKETNSTLDEKLIRIHGKNNILVEFSCTTKEINLSSIFMDVIQIEETPNKRKKRNLLGIRSFDIETDKDETIMSFFENVSYYLNTDKMQPQSFSKEVGYFTGEKHNCRIFTSSLIYSAEILSIVSLGENGVLREGTSPNGDAWFFIECITYNNEKFHVIYNFEKYYPIKVSNDMKLITFHITAGGMWTDKHALNVYDKCILDSLVKNYISF